MNYTKTPHSGVLVVGVLFFCWFRSNNKLRAGTNLSGFAGFVLVTIRFQFKMTPKQTNKSFSTSIEGKKFWFCKLENNMIFCSNKSMNMNKMSIYFTNKNNEFLSNKIFANHLKCN